MRDGDGTSDHDRGRPVGEGAWVILPTYNEAENLPGDRGRDPRDAARRDAARRGRQLARRHRRARRAARRRTTRGSGSGIASSSRAWARRTSTGSASRSSGGARSSIQMDADWSHDPAALPSLIAPITDDAADLVIGSRYTKGGAVEDWGIVRADHLARRLDVREGSSSASSPNDLTGGFKAWRASTLESVPFDGVRAGGYVFQIEMTYRASRLGARVAEVPITFRDRRVGQSKMSRRIVVEALFVVIGPALGRAPRPRAGAQGPGDRSTAAPAGGRAPVRDARPAPPRCGRRAGPRPASASSSTSARSRTRSGPRSRPIYLEQLLTALDADPARRRVVLVPPRGRPGRPDRRAGRASTSSAAGCCRRPGCCGPAP